MSNLLSMTRDEAEQASFVVGEVVKIDRKNKTFTVTIDGTEYSDIPVFYNCQGGDETEGFKAFQIGDNVLIKANEPNGVLSHENLLVIGFSDGYPRMCTRRLIMFSVFDGNPSYYYSGNNHVIWDIDAKEIVIGPCSLIALQTAGFIDQLSPDIIMRGDFIFADGFIKDYEEPPSFTANANVLQPTALDMDDLDDQLIWEGDLPDWDASNNGTAGPVDVTSLRECYLPGVSQEELNSSKEADLDGEYTTRNIEDFIVGYDPQPDYYVKTYEFTETMTGDIEDANCLTRVYYLDQELSSPGDDVPKEWAGCFVVKHTDFTNVTTKIGGTRWVNSGSFFSSSINERYRTTVQDDESSTNSKYYSPIGLLKEIDTTTSTDRTTYQWGANDPELREDSAIAENPTVEIKAFSALTIPELVKEGEELFYEQISCAVYVLSGSIGTDVNGALSSSEAIDPEVNVSVDVYNMTDYSEYFAFESSNIEVLAGAIAEALKNSDGGTEVATTFFRGKIE